LSENSPVRHRIDGLEKSGIGATVGAAVRHRIDGLEIHWDSVAK